MSRSVLVPSQCTGPGGPGPGGRSIGNSGDAAGDHGIESFGFGLYEVGEVEVIR